jgi:two-component system, response regulator
MPNTSPAPKVLLVEDNLDDENLTLRALRHLRPEPVTFIARDGATAVDWLEQYLIIEKPSLVLLDLKLPKLDGKDVLRALLRLPGGTSVPVVVFSSSDDSRDIEACMALGAKEYHRKPIEFEEYLATVEDLATRYLYAMHP